MGLGRIFHKFRVTSLNHHTSGAGSLHARGFPAMDALTALGFARDSYLNADTARDAAVSHLDDEDDEHRSVITAAENTLMSAVLAYMAALECIGITSNEAAVANKASHWYDARVPSLIRTVGPDPHRFHLGQRVRSHRLGVEGEVCRTSADGTLAEVAWDDGREGMATVGMVDFVAPKPVAEPVHQGADAAEFGPMLVREKAEAGPKSRFNTMYLPRKKVAADPIS